MILATALSSVSPLKLTYLVANRGYVEFFSNDIFLFGVSMLFSIVTTSLDVINKLGNSSLDELDPMFVILSNGSFEFVINTRSSVTTSSTFSSDIFWTLKISPNAVNDFSPTVTVKGLLLSLLTLKLAAPFVSVNKRFF